MSSNDVIVLNSILNQKKIELANTFSDNDYFEIFTFEQALKDYDLSYDELLSGRVDGADDGGIDGFFVFINNELLDDDVDLTSIRRSPIIDIYIVQAKVSSSFQEAAIEKFIATIQDIFDLGKKIANIQKYYNSALIEKVEIFQKAYVTLANRHPEIRVIYIYASKGNCSEIHHKVQHKAENLKNITQGYFVKADIEVNFLGARELLEAARQEKTYSLQLRFLENYISRGEDNYIVLSGLKDYYEFVTDNNGNLRKYLFESNVRDYQGDVEVNRDIRSTLESNNTSIDFWWLNNGITILASKASVTGKVITLDDVQIVNGLQTTNTLYQYRKAFDSTDSDNKYSLVKVQDERAILIKIIVENNLEARDRIIKATNFQTPIPASSLRATEPIQRDIEDYFLQNDWFYDRRKNYYKNIGKPSDKIVGIPYLAQAVTSIVYREPHNAKARPTTIIKGENNYNRIFNSTINIQVYLFCAKLIKKIESYIRSDFSRLRQDNSNELLRHSTIRSLIFHIAMLFTSKMLRKANYVPRDVASLVTEELDNEVLAQTIIEIIDLTNSYLQLNNSLPLNTAAKRSDFTNFLIEKVNVYPCCPIKLTPIGNPASTV
jgi:AIPR protein